MMLSGGFSFLSFCGMHIISLSQKIFFLGKFFAKRKRYRPFGKSGESRIISRNKDNHQISPDCQPAALRKAIYGMAYLLQYYYCRKLLRR